MREKSLAKNSVYNVIYKSLNVLFPLITSMYVSRVLLSDGVGVVASAKNLVTYFTLLAAAGLPIYGTKRIAEQKNNQDSLEIVFSELFVINLVSTLLYSLAYYLIISFVGIYKKDLLLYEIVGLQVVLNIFNIDWFYQGIEEYGYIMLRSLLIKVISFAFIVLLVRDREDYIYYAFATVLGVCLNYVFNVIHLRRYVRIRIQGIHIKRHLKYLLVLFSSAIAMEIYTLSDITMLTIMKDSSCVGYYSNAVNGIKTIKEVIVAVCAVFLPRLSYCYANGDKDKFAELAGKGIKILLYFSIPAAVGCFLLADKIVLILFGNTFIPAIKTVQILSISIITIGLSNFIGYQILVVIGKEKVMLCISILGAILNITLNSFFIPMYAHNGAAVASVITELVVCSFYIYSYKKGVNIISFFKDTIITIVIPVVVMILCIVWIRIIPLSLFFSTLISIGMGSIIYFSCSLFMKNEIALLLKNKIINIGKKD